MKHCWQIVWMAPFAALLLAHPVYAARTTRTVAVTGQGAPGVDGTFSLDLSRAVMNTLGRVAFKADFISKSDGASLDGIWAESNDGPLRLLAFEGETVSGTLSDGPIGGLGAPRLNDAGEVVYEAGHSPPNSQPKTAVWYDAPSVGRKLIAFSDQAVAPTGHLLGYPYPALLAEPIAAFGGRNIFFEAPRYNPLGFSTDVLWQAGANQSLTPVAVPAAVYDFQNRSAVAGSELLYGLPDGLMRRAANGNWIVEVADNATAPGTGKQFSDFPNVAIGGGGHYAFSASLKPLSSGSSTSSKWIKSGGALTLLALEGAHPPGEPDSVWAEDFDRISVNDDGIASWHSRLIGDFDNDDGIWIYQGGSVQEVLREGDTAPGLAANEVILSLGRPYLNNEGETLFWTDYGSRHTSAPKSAVWLRSVDGALQSVVRTGDTIDVDNGPDVDMRTIKSVRLNSEEQSFNDSGGALVLTTFTDNSMAWIVVSSSVSGDFNSDGVVDGDDLAQWAEDFGVNHMSDADGDADSDGTDFLVWQRNLGLGVGTASAVPEPAVTGWSILIVAVVFARRR